MRDSLVFYASFNEAIEALPEEEQLKAYKAITNYALKGVEPTKEIGIAYALFLAIKPQIDANNQRYENSSKGGRPKTKKPMVLENEENSKPMVSEFIETKKPMVLENEENSKPNENVNENVNEKEKEKENTKEKAPRFSPPSLEEVRAYCQERGNVIDPEQFVNFYESKGWKIGKEKMKDWKACVRTWEKRNKISKPNYSIDNSSLSITEEDIAKYLPRGQL